MTSFPSMRLQNISLKAFLKKKKKINVVTSRCFYKAVIWCRIVVFDFVFKMSEIGQALVFKEIKFFHNIVAE